MCCLLQLHDGAILCKILRGAYQTCDVQHLQTVEHLQSILQAQSAGVSLDLARLV